MPKKLITSLLYLAIILPSVALAKKPEACVFFDSPETLAPSWLCQTSQQDEKTFTTIGGGETEKDALEHVFNNMWWGGMAINYHSTRVNGSCLPSKKLKSTGEWIRKQKQVNVDELLNSVDLRLIARAVSPRNRVYLYVGYDISRCGASSTDAYDNGRWVTNTAVMGHDVLSPDGFTASDLSSACSMLKHRYFSARDFIKDAQKTKGGLVPLMKKYICDADFIADFGGKRKILEYVVVHRSMVDVIDFLNHFKDHKMFAEMGDILNTRDDEGRTTLDYVEYLKTKPSTPEIIQRLDKLSFYFCAFRGRYSDPEKNKSCKSHY